MSTSKQRQSRRARFTKKLVDDAAPAEKPYEIHDTGTTGLTLRVQPSGVKTYYCRYALPDGGRGRVKLGRVGEVKTVDVARDLATAARGDVVKGVDPQEKKREARRKKAAHTLKSFLDKEYGPWAEEHLGHGKAAVARIKSCFGGLLDKKLDKIHTFQVEKCRSDRLKAKVKPGTVNRDISALKACLSKAVEWGLLGAHPLKGLKPSRVDGAAKVRYLTNGEELALRQALDDREARIRAGRASANAWRRKRGYDEKPDLSGLPFADYLKPAVLVSLNTGLRRGELFSLTWDNVDLERALLTVEGRRAKSGRTRHVPLSAEAVDVLKKWREQTGGEGAAFQNRDGAPIGNLRKSWVEVLKDAGVKDFRWHDMRHHFASKLVMAGVDLNTVRELLGHADIAMTLRYAHLAPEHRAAAVAHLKPAVAEDARPRPRAVK